LFILVLLVSVVWMQGRSSAQSSDKSSSPTSLQGCLKFTDGHYRLTDDTGAVHQLSGEVNRLTHYVGKRVEVTGMPAVRTVDTTQEGAASSVREQNVFRVKTVKQTADTCSLAK
jgi:hypothetical protein